MSRLRSALVAFLLAAAPAAVVLSPQVAQATAPARWAYVAASDPTAASYTPSLAYQRQSNGRRVKISRSAAGVYGVVFPGLASGKNGGIVQVTAYDSDGTCQVGGWGNTKSGNVQADVWCFAPGGALADSNFDATYTVGSGTGDFAYAWDDRSSSSGPVDGFYAFDGKGGTITSAHTGTGSYTVKIPHLAGFNGTVKVTAYAESQTLCTILGWGDGTVRVACVDSTGTPIDSDFNITFANKSTLLGVARRTSGYLSNDGLNSSYTASGSYKYNSTGRADKVKHQDPGEYTVSLYGFSQAHGDVQVSAYGRSDVYCNTTGWHPGTSAELVYISCYDSTGAPADSLFTTQFTV